MKAYAGCLFLFLGFQSWAGQTQVSAPQGPPPGIGTMGFSGTAFAMPAMSGKPYSAKQVSEHNQTLADGTHITQPPRTAMMYRDSAGRTRTERPMGPPNVELADQYLIVEIRDPIAQVQYTLDPVNKVAHRVVMQAPPRPNVNGPGVAAVRSGVLSAQLPAPDSQSSASSGSVSTAGARGGLMSGSASTGAVITNGPNGVQHQNEDLGTQTMEGLVVHGRKLTMTVPEGAQGNDRPLTTVTETWVSRDLGLTVLSHSVDPRNGESTIRMTEISTTEPDPSLFAPPPDYSVVEETGPFQIKFYAQPKQQQ